MLLGRHWAEFFIWIGLFIATIQGRENYYAHFPDEETDLWREFVTFPRSCLMEKRVRAWKLVHIIFWSRLLALTMNKQLAFVFEKETNFGHAE